MFALMKAIFSSLSRRFTPPPLGGGCECSAAVIDASKAQAFHFPRIGWVLEYFTGEFQLFLLFHGCSANMSGRVFFSQDDMAMLRALYIGTLVADRDRYRAGRPGMRVQDAHMIESPDERAKYLEICNTLHRAGMTGAALRYHSHCSRFVSLAHRRTTLENSSPSSDSSRPICQKTIYQKFRRSSSTATVSSTFDM